MGVFISKQICLYIKRYLDLALHRFLAKFVWLRRQAIPIPACKLKAVASLSSVIVLFDDSQVLLLQTLICDIYIIFERKKGYRHACEHIEFTIEKKNATHFIRELRYCNSFVEILYFHLSFW